MQPFVQSLAVVSLTTLLAACGSSQAEPETPASESETSEPSGASSEEESGPVAEAEEAEAEAEEAPPKHERTPKDIVTAEGVLFSFSFNDSEAYHGAEEKCVKQAKDDPQKKAECMQKARDQFDADSIAFQEDNEGKWWWITLRKRGTSLKALHKFEIEFGEETDDSIKILPKGRDKGSKPMRAPKEVVIGVPNESEIVLADPKHGKMIYKAKMGLIGEAER